MLSWYGQLYMGEGAAKYARRIRRRADAGKTDVGHWFITLASNGSDELDLIPGWLLSQKNFRARVPMIVGIAADRREALDLVVRIADECYRATGDANIREWLLSRERKKQAGVR